mmetsp:Transcript_49741/g.111948  ORF Transcript_49741/g.111948 Transcript_49741/m.111948 type:complete len:346 (-) Transcript_49741:113-1150(-)
MGMGQQDGFAPPKTLPRLQRIVMVFLICMGAVLHTFAYCSVALQMAHVALGKLGDSLPESEMAVDTLLDLLPADFMELEHLTSGLAGHEFVVSARRLTDEDETAIGFLFFAVFVAVISATICCCGGLCYHCNITAKRSPFPGAGMVAAPGIGLGVGDFTNQPFACFEDLDYCIMGWCCFQCRTGDTWHAAGLLPFWMGFSLVVFLDCLAYTGAIIMQVSILGNLLFYAAEMTMFFMLMIFRIRLRRAVGKDHACNCCDCLMAFCCPACANCQEAKEIDGIMNVRTQPCCCDIFPTSSPPATITVVGQPVAAAVVAAEQPAQAEVVVVQATVVGVRGNYVHPEPEK